MDPTWLALTVLVFAIVAITCLVWSMLKLARTQHLKKASRYVAADAEGTRRILLTDFSSAPLSPRVFIGS